MSAHDISLLRLYDPLGDALGYFGSKVYDRAWQDGNYWALAGYPVAVTSERPSFQLGIPVLDNDVDGDAMELEHQGDTTGGDSGGPFFGTWPDGFPYVIGTVSGGESFTGGEDNNIRIWQIHTGECCYVLNGHTAAITGAAFSPDGKHLASSSKDATVRIWDVATGTCVKILTGHTDLVNFVVYHPDSQRQLLASCSHDETIRLWNPETGECVKMLRPQRVYEGMNIAGAKGLTPAQLVTLKALGAIDES